MPPSTDFANSLKRLRLAKGLSQEDLSALAGVDRTYISMLERGKRSPSLITIEKIAAALEMETWEFIKGI